MTVFFFNDTATTEIYTLSLHDALPISVLRLLDLATDRGDHDVAAQAQPGVAQRAHRLDVARQSALHVRDAQRSEEHTSELQSRQYLVCRLLLEKKKTKDITIPVDQHNK